MASPGATYIEGGNVSGPDHAEQEGDQRRAVGLFAQGGHGHQRHADVKEAEDGGRGIGQHLFDGAEKGAVDQQGQAG